MALEVCQSGCASTPRHSFVGLCLYFTLPEVQTPQRSTPAAAAGCRHWPGVRSEYYLLLKDAPLGGVVHYVPGALLHPAEDAGQQKILNHFVLVRIVATLGPNHNNIRFGDCLRGDFSLHNVTFQIELSLFNPHRSQFTL